MAAATFDEIIEKFNPYHDSRGRFSSSHGAASFTFHPHTASGRAAIAREKVRTGGENHSSPKGSSRGAGKGSSKGSSEKPKAEKPAGTRDHVSAKEYFGGTKDEKKAVEVLRNDLSKNSGKKVTTKEADDMWNSVVDYSGSSYKKIRAAQSGKGGSAKDKQAGDRLEKLIDLSPKWGGGELYRGINISSEQIKSLSKGSTLDMAGTSSWSSDKKNAETFLRGGGSKVMFVLPSTKRGTSINHLSSIPGEHEVIVSKKSKFTVEQTKKGRGVTYVYLSEV
jgi:hypothetical protein